MIGPALALQGLLILASPPAGAEALVDTWRAIPEYETVRLTPEAARADLALLRKALETVHPGLYRYVAEETIDDRLDRLEASVADGTTDIDLYATISLALAEIRCGHTRVEAPPALTEYRRRVPTHLPFRFRLFGARMIVETAGAEAAGLERGQEVLSINGVSVGDLVERIGATVPVDGFVDWIRPSRLETAYEFDDSGLDHYLPVFHGFRDDFTLEVAAPGSPAPTTVTVPAITTDAWRALASAGPRSFRASVRTERLDDETVLLEVGSFINYRDTVDPVALLTPIFRDLNASGAAHLIVDLRDNGGGSSDAAWALAGFLVDEPIRFKPPLVKTYRFDDELRAHLRTWAEGAMDMPAEAFVERADGWYELRPEASGRAIELAPHPDRFRGRITALIGPFNASGTTMLLATLKERGRVTLVGEPTGGSAEGPTAGLLFFLSLPNSGITVNIPAMRERAPVDSFAPGAGVTPDVPAAATVDDFLSGRDRALALARALGAKE